MQSDCKAGCLKDREFFAVARFQTKTQRRAVKAYGFIQVGHHERDLAFAVFSIGIHYTLPFLPRLRCLSRRSPVDASPASICKSAARRVRPAAVSLNGRRR